MTDRNGEPDLEMEQLIGRYGLLEPPADLRPRVMAAASSAMRARRVAWAAGIAAVVALALQWQAGRTYRAIAAPEVQAEEAERSLQVASIAEAFGGDERAVRSATLLVEASAREAAIPVAPPLQLEEWAR